MSSSTKVTLALLVLFAGAIAVYYMVNAGPATTEAAVPVEPTQPSSRTPSSNSSATSPARSADRGLASTPPRSVNPSSSAPGSGRNGGLLTDSLNAAREQRELGTERSALPSAERTNPSVSTLPTRTTTLPTNNSGDASHASIEPDKDGAPASFKPPYLSPGTTPGASSTPGSGATPPATTIPKPIDSQTPVRSPETRPLGSSDAKPAVPLTTSPVAAPSRMQQYTVAEGDNMWSIAQAWFGDGNKWDLIAKANPFVDPEHLKVGQSLNMPAKDAQRAAPAAPPEPAGSAGGAVIYVVTSGDTLRQIARTYYGDANKWQVIFDANKAALDDDPHSLQVGMKLTIPPAPTAASAKPKS